MSMCKSAIPALIARLEDPSRPGRQMAMEFIGGCAARFQTHDDGAPFVPSLVKLMHEEDAVLVLEAARTLGKLNLEAGLAVPALASGLEHADPQVRRVSAEALELFGREAQSAIPALQRTLEDSDPLIPSISVKVYDPFSGCGWRDSPNGLARVWSLMDTSS
jgi:HEAT repeat protein